MNESNALPAPSPATPRRVVLMIKSVQIAHQAGYYLLNGRWHAIQQAKPAPAGAPVVAEKPASGHTRMTSEMWGQLYAHADNSNKATFTKKLDKLKQAYQAGDAHAILAGSYPNDTTNKKVVKVANYLLGLMGSEHTVTPGLKLGTHHALDGAAPAPVEANAPEVYAQPVAPEAVVDDPAPQPVPEPATDPAATAEAPPTTLATPDFIEGKLTTGVIDYYADVAMQVQALAAASDVAGLEKLKADGLMPNKSGKVGNTWKGKTQNSIMLLALHEQAMEQAGGNTVVAAPAPEPAPPAPEPKTDFLEKIKSASSISSAEMFVNLHHAQHGYSGKAKAEADAALAEMKAANAAPVVADVPPPAALSGPAGKPAYDHIAQSLKNGGFANSAADEWVSSNPSATAWDEVNNALNSLGYEHLAVYGHAPFEDPAPAPAPIDPITKLGNALSLASGADQAGKEAFNFLKEQGTTPETVGQVAAALKANGYDELANGFQGAKDKAAAITAAKAGNLIKPDVSSPHWANAADEIEAALASGDLPALQKIVSTSTGFQSPDAVAINQYASAALKGLGGAPATLQEAGPKEGDTKQGADGMLVLKDGHWVKMDQGQPTNDVHPIDAIPEPDLSDFNNPAFVAGGLFKLKQAIKAEGAAALKGVTKKMKASGKLITALPHPHKPGGTYKIVGYVGSSDSHTKLFEYVESLKAAAGKNPSKPKAQVKAAAPTVAPAPVPAEPAHPSMDDWKQIGPQGGTNPGGKFVDQDGVEWYCKFPDNENMAKSEVLAAKLYAAAGIAGQDAKLITKDGKVGIASKWVDVSQASPAVLAKAKGAKAGFAVDAWLANHDVVGLNFDNLQVDAAGNAMRVDAGGSLEYRAQGAKKEFGNTVTEIDTLRDKAINDKSAAVFGKMTKADITASVTNVMKVSNAQIYALVNTYGPGNAEDKAKLAATLVARKADLLAKYPKAKKDKKIVFNPEGISAPPSFTNWGGSGNSGPSSKEFINLANEKAVQSIYSAAQTGNPEAVKGLSTETYNKATGEVTGTAPVLDHPSQHVKGYAQQAINEINQQLNPPKVFRFDGGHPLHSLNDAYPAVNGAKHGDTVEKAGKFLVLGSPGVVDPVALGLEKSSWANGALTQATYSSVAHAIVSSMPVTQKQAIVSYTGAGYGAMNTSLWSGNPTGASKSAAEALNTLGHEIKPGTVLSRKLSLSGVGLDQILASTGKILQEPAIMSTSIRPSSWSGNTQLKLHVGPGVKGLWVGKGSAGGNGGLSQHQGEDEMVLPPNTRILVLSVKKVSGPDADGFGNGVNHVIEAVILPSEQPAK